MEIQESAWANRRPTGGVQGAQEPWDTHPHFVLTGQILKPWFIHGCISLLRESGDSSPLTRVIGQFTPVCLNNATSKLYPRAFHKVRNTSSTRKKQKIKPVWSPNINFYGWRGHINRNGNLARRVRKCWRDFKREARIFSYNVWDLLATSSEASTSGYHGFRRTVSKCAGRLRQLAEAAI